MRLLETAYAKINLYLRVLGIRDDGFHGVDTVMHTVSLADTLRIELSPSEKTEVLTETDAPFFIPSEKNLATRAALLFLEKAKFSYAVHIFIEKKIPASAGLAGGSSDAAAVLRALNRAFDYPFSESELLSLGAMLGSDVPYCILGGTALCTGRGEVISRRLEAPTLYFAVASSGERVSTPKAYAELDSYRLSNLEPSEEAEKNLVDLLSWLSSGTLPTSLYNSFEPIVLPSCKGAAALREQIRSFGATHAMMSGSGPSVFGVFDTEAAARECVERLTAEGTLAFFARSV